MYVKAYYRRQGEWQPFCVEEMTKRELKHSKRVNPRHLHLVITGREAHQWVRDGGIHGTKLYVEQGRIRRAGE